MNAKTKKQTLAAMGANIKTARLRCGWTQAELAKKLGISIAYASLLERGGRNPPATTVVELARWLDVPPGALLGKAA